MRGQLIKCHILVGKVCPGDESLCDEEVQGAVNRGHPDILLRVSGLGGNLSCGQGTFAVEQDIPDIYALLGPFYACRPMFDVQEKVLLFVANAWFYHRRSSFESQAGVLDGER